MEKLKKGKSAKKEDLDDTKKLETVRLLLLGDNCAHSRCINDKLSSFMLESSHTATKCCGLKILAPSHGSA